MDTQLRKLVKLNPSLRFEYLIDYHTPTNPLEYQRINSNQIGNESWKLDKKIEELEINFNIQTKIIKGEIGEGFKGLFRGEKTPIISMSI